MEYSYEYNYEYRQMLKLVGLSILRNIETEYQIKYIINLEKK